MTDTAKANRDFADELLAQAREQLAREASARVRPDEERERVIRQQIETTKQRGRDNPLLENKERLRELGREHYRRTGSNGGAT
ncbi:hypothetical protein [Acidisoma cladoniae]|uniref:hypothetical protein n=1 Tax=Acidisoma cladoniae TaxID=3040935 RepID=UPI00254DCDC2|nr:hypothetical protein [Acidisoma sp. PAMC 29798]